MPKKRVFTTAEAAEYIGVSRWTLELARSKNADRLKFRAPPHVQSAPGARVVYLLEDLDAWLAANKRDPRGRPRKKAAVEQTAQ